MFHPSDPTLAQLSRALLQDVAFGIEHSQCRGVPYRMTIEADEELDVSEYLRDRSDVLDLGGDSELDGPDTIRCTGKGWTLVLKVN